MAVSKGAWAALKADFRANAPNLSDPPRRDELVRELARNVPTVRFAAVALLRFSQAVGRRVPLGGSVLKQLNHMLTGCDFAYQADVGPGLVLYHPTGIVVGPNCRIGARARIMQGVTIGSDAVIVGEEDGRSPEIGDHAFVGPGAVVVGAVSLGNHVQVGANAVVTSSFGDRVVVAGAPARVIRRLDDA